MSRVCVLRPCRVQRCRRCAPRGEAGVPHVASRALSGAGPGVRLCSGVSQQPSRGLQQAVHGPGEGAAGWPGSPAGRPLARPQTWGLAGHRLLHALPRAVPALPDHTTVPSPGRGPWGLGLACCRGAPQVPGTGGQGRGLQAKGCCFCADSWGCCPCRQGQRTFQGARHVTCWDTATLRWGVWPTNISAKPQMPLMSERPPGGPQVGPQAVSVTRNV